MIIKSSVIWRLCLWFFKYVWYYISR